MKLTFVDAPKEVLTETEWYISLDGTVKLDEMEESFFALDREVPFRFATNDSDKERQTFYLVPDKSGTIPVGDKKGIPVINLSYFLKFIGFPYPSKVTVKTLEYQKKKILEIELRKKVQARTPYKRRAKKEAQ
jgi:hypothetical protein